MTDSDDICGYEGTGTGEPCRNPVAGENGRCYIPSHNAAADGGDPDAVENPQGANSKLPEVREDILEAARDGLAKEACAHAAGIHKSTLYDWLDEEGDRYHEDFAAEFRQARAEGERTLIKGGLYDDDVDTTMAKFVLATSFGRTKTEKREVDASHEHTGEGGGPIQIEFHEEVVETPWEPGQEGGGE